MFYNITTNLRRTCKIAKKGSHLSSETKKIPGVQKARIIKMVRYHAMGVGYCIENVTGDTLVLNKGFPSFMLENSLLYAERNPIFPPFPA